MTDRALLDSLEGQQYLVLRPESDVAAYFREAQAGVRDRFPHPRTGHVTLRGFSEPERIDAVRQAVTEWAEQQAPIELQVEGVDGFPPPFQVLIARLRRSRTLVNAYASLTAILDQTDLQRIGELPLDDWVFHLSIAYANTIDHRAWDRLLSSTRETLPDGPTETITTAEFVWFHDGAEHSDVLPLKSTCD